MVRYKNLKKKLHVWDTITTAAESSSHAEPRCLVRGCAGNVKFFDTYGVTVATPVTEHAGNNRKELYTQSSFSACEPRQAQVLRDDRERPRYLSSIRVLHANTGGEEGGKNKALRLWNISLESFNLCFYSEEACCRDLRFRLRKIREIGIFAFGEPEGRSAKVISRMRSRRFVSRFDGSHF